MLLVLSSEKHRAIWVFSVKILMQISFKRGILNIVELS